MPLILKEKEVCMISNRCKYVDGSNGVGKCQGTNPNRSNDFTCNFADEIINKANHENIQVPSSPDIIIKGKALLHG